MIRRHAPAFAVHAILAAYSLVATRYYTATAVVHLSPNAGQEFDSDLVVNDLTAQWNRQIFVSTQIALLESRLLRTKVLDRYALLGREDALGVSAVGLAALDRAIEILPRKSTELIDIRVTTTDPEQAAVIANLTAAVFSDESLAANTDAAGNARKWLTGQLVEYEARILRRAPNSSPTSASTTWRTRTRRRPVSTPGCRT